VTSYRVLLAARVEDQIREAEEWWRQARPSAPHRFREELVAVLERLATMPHTGAPYRPFGRLAIRRLLLRRSRYHVYYSIDEAAGAVLVRAVWHSARGRSPRVR
jgi:plasmid stabilization system protein ParE